MNQAIIYLNLLDELDKSKHDTTQDVQHWISKIAVTVDVHSTIATNYVEIQFASQIVQILGKIKDLLKFDEQFDAAPEKLDTFITLSKGINLVLNTAVYKFAGCYFRITEKPPNVEKAQFPIEFMQFLLDYLNFNSVLRLNTDLKPIKLLLYGVFCLLYHARHIDRDERLEVIMDEKLKSRLYELPLSDAIQTLMKINTTALSKEMSEIVTDKLKCLIQKPNGFYSFIDVIVKSKEDDQPPWKKGEIASRIVSAKGHSLEFYKRIVDEIFFYLNDSNDERHKEYIPIYVVTLSRIYFISNDDLQKMVRIKLFRNIDPLVTPPELLTGFVVLDDSEFRRSIQLIHKTFCRTSSNSMKTVLLVPYILVLFKLYSLLPEEVPEKSMINLIIVQCLVNRSQSQLQSIVECLIFNKAMDGVSNLHDRIGIQITNQLKISFLIVPANDSGFQQFYNPIENFIQILRKSSNNIFIHSIFIIVLKLFEIIYEDSNAAPAISSDLLHVELNSDQENLNNSDRFLTDILMKNFDKKILIVNLLNEIILITEFHSQISENSIEVINFIKNYLTKQIVSRTKVVNDNLLIIIFSLIKIFPIEMTKSHEIVNLLQRLKQLNNLSDFMVKQINLLIYEVTGTGNDNQRRNEEYQTALALCNETEAFLQVYGIHTLIKLSRDNDENIEANKYELLLLGLRILKNDQDSYTYLNCINFMIELVPLLKQEFFDTLIIEFENAQNELDYRLKIGEIIVKITECLNDGAYKYKDLLINCFMKGSRNCLDEFRTSSLSNLGTVCRIFSYQVHHFFQELMLLTESIITTDTYLPSRRAAIMVLSHLLFGIDNIMNFQEYLIPIYRALKNIVQNESDREILMHAEIGLEHLNMKTKEFLLPEQKLRKREIKIMGIKDDEPEITTKKIIQLN